MLEKAEKLSVRVMKANMVNRWWKMPRNDTALHSIRKLHYYWLFFCIALKKRGDVNIPFQEEESNSSRS